MIFLEKGLDVVRFIDLPWKCLSAKGQKREIIRNEEIVTRKCNIAWQRMNISEWNSDELGFIDRFDFGALLCEGLRLYHGE